MKRITILLVAFQFIFVMNLFAQKEGKIPLDHSVYDGWKDLRNVKISYNGKWVSYEINPQKGDGWLCLVNVTTGTKDSLARGYRAIFSPNSDFLTFKIKPQEKIIRQAKVDKKKEDQMPKDSLGIWTFSDNSIKKVERVKSFKVPEENSSWVVYHLEKQIEKEDTTQTEFEEENEKKEKSKGKKGKLKGTDLVIFNPVTLKEHIFNNVTDYSVSKNGALISFIKTENDSIEISDVYSFSTSKEQVAEIFESEGLSKKITTDETGEQVAFIHSGDTAKTKVYSLYHWNIKSDQAKIVTDTLTEGIPDGWSVSENGDIYFSEDGLKLFFGTAPKPEPEPEDTLLDEEKVILDVWNWKDPMIQPQQKVNAEREKKRTYLAVYHTDKGKMVQLGNEEILNVNPILKGNGNIAMGTSNKPYLKLISWDANRYQDVYLVDLITGDHKLIMKKVPSSVSFSPKGTYLIWYGISDSSWYARSILKDITVSLTRNIPVSFYNELHNSPSEARPYGIAGWIENDEYVLIYDRYDIWKADPTGKQKPINLTNEYGRKNNIRFRYVKLDRDALFIGSKEDMLLSGFHNKNKQGGFFSINVKSSGDPGKLIFEDYRFYSPQKAKNADLLIWQKCSFVEYQDLWVSDLNFRYTNKISNTNPQQSKYLWGTAELVEWTSPKNEQLQGILYKPENFDPSKKYPMIVYFYERSSDGLNSHRTPSPSRSTINYPYCISNGYLVFVPDITYEIGYPGESAYNAVISGTMSLIEKYDFVDKDHIGLDGHSWGGYQIAYIVTQTNLFKAAYAGAPVCNMTSAYGGIRWGSGMSRMFQYEQTQSRIGGTLWEKPVHYIQNSPLFFAPKIETPVLMMHNDDDGAVPWYQGIEFFVALRRLNKPVWMLNYNDEPHSLRRRPNMTDMSIRKMQFFDHFLKETPAPVWMEKGIPAVEKGINMGYELIEK